MKFFNRLQLLSITIILLVGVVISISLLNTQSEQKGPEHFYCGNAFYQESLKSNHSVGEQLFKENCKSCHKIHEDAVGPALAGVTERRSRKWLYAFIKNSEKLIQKKDSAAINIYKKFGRAEMVAFSNFTNSDIDSILIYIESISHSRQY